jgi:predicted NBD/HSP70 family sugar kinase
VRQLLQLAQEGDAGCQRVVADAGRVVGRAVADLCNYLNPDLVVVGGDLSAAGDLVLEPMREAVRRFAIPGRRRGRRDRRWHARRPRRAAGRARPRRP